LENGGAVGGEDAGGDLHLMVKAWVGEDFEAGADGAAFGVVSAVDQARDTSLDHGAGAHTTGLDGDVESGVGEAVVAEQVGGFAENDDFGVGGGVAIADRAVAGTGEDLGVVDEDGADGDFAGLGSGARFGERFLHELDFCFHLSREDNMRQEGNGVYTEGIEHKGYGEE
jgi:hypothetical protein